MKTRDRGDEARGTTVPPWRTRPTPLGSWPWLLAGLLVALSLLSTSGCDESESITGTTGGSGPDAGQGGDGGTTGIGGDAGTGGGAVPDGLAPVLSSFRIEDGAPDRVYFDSSKPIVASTAAGFTVSGKTVASIAVEPGQTTGHYVTVSEPFTFWDNHTIRYEGGSDLESFDGVALYDFTLRYVENQLPEPTPTATPYYVRTTGLDSNDGLSPTTAFRTLGQATSVQARVIYVEAGDYGADSVVIDYDGTAAQPILIQGYQSLTGGLPDPLAPNYWTWGDYGTGVQGTLHVDDSELPTLDGGDRTSAGVGVTVGAYVILRNLQVTQYSTGLKTVSSSHLIVDNFVGVSLGDDTGGSATECPEGRGIQADSFLGHGRFRNITLADVAPLYMLRHRGSFSLFTDIRMYQDAGIGDWCSAPDYYLSLYGSATTGGSNNIIRNVVIDRLGSLPGSAHGISLKSWDLVLEHNLIENSTAVNMRPGIELRHDHVKYNVVRNIEAYARPSDGGVNTGVGILNNASSNIIEDCVLHDLGRGILFADGLEQGEQPAGHDNLFRNIVVHDCGAFIATGGSLTTGTPPYDNRFINLTVDSCGHLSATNWGMPASNVIVNSTFSNIADWEVLPAKPDPEITYESCNFWSNGTTFATPDGTNIVELEPLFVDAASQDYHLQDTSPIRDVGSDLTDNRYDLDGVERLDGSYSIGAFER